MRFQFSGFLLGFIFRASLLTLVHCFSVSTLSFCFLWLHLEDSEAAEGRGDGKRIWRGWRGTRT